MNLLSSPSTTCTLSTTMSSSEPNLCKTKHSDMTPSNCPKRSSHSSPFWRKGRKPNGWRGGSMKSNLTEDRKKLKCSPYYKGLTDSTLYIDRKRCGGLSPGRESHGSASTSSSISTVFTRILKWGFKGKEDSSVSMIHTREPSSATRVTKIVDGKEMKGRKKDISLIEMKRLSFEEKPLGERELASGAAPQPVLFRKKVIVVQEKAKEVITNEEGKFVWANKYRPKALKDFICNRDTAEKLQAMVKKGHCSHFIFEGPPGVGKRTMIWALLTEVFGPDRLQTREECKEFELKGEAIASIHVNVKVSSQHLEINLSELRGYEKHVIVSLIKETKSLVISEAMQCDHTNCQAIILYGADKLSTDAQLYIRWLMERYKGCKKFFFCCSDASKLQTIWSLCTIFQLLPPSDEKIVEVLEFIATQEGIELPHQLAKRIAGNSKHNLRQAIRSFEATWWLNYPFKEDQILMTGWEEDISNIAKNIIEEQSPKQLFIIRGKLQNFKDHSVSSNFVFSTLVGELKKHLYDQYHPQMDASHQDYKNDNRIILASEKYSMLLHNLDEELDKRMNDPMSNNLHHFIWIEEFAAKFMSFYKNTVMKNIKEPEGYAS